MKTVDIKTSELSGAALDWAVAVAIAEPRKQPVFRAQDRKVYQSPYHMETGYNFSPSTNWAQGGPIIERENICVNRRHQCDPAYCPIIDPLVCWVASDTAGGYLSYGPNPLIAAMRCYVASKLGEVVSVPAELVD